MCLIRLWPDSIAGTALSLDFQAGFSLGILEHLMSQQVGAILSSLLFNVTIDRAFHRVDHSIQLACLQHVVGIGG